MAGPQIVPAVGKHTATIIFSHGLGDSSRGWYPVARELSRVPSLQHIKWILPNAPVQPVTLNAGMPMPSWFDIRSLDANPTSREEDEEGMMKSVGTITNLVKAEVDAGIRSERVVVGGFSQGAVIALLTGLTSPLKLGGIVSLSGFLGLSDKARELQVSHAKEYEVFWGHGTSDQVVRYAWGQASVEKLKELGWGKIRFESYPRMPHSFCEDEQEHLVEFLEKTLPAESSNESTANGAAGRL